METVYFEKIWYIQLSIKTFSILILEFITPEKFLKVQQVKYRWKMPQTDNSRILMENAAFCFFSNFDGNAANC